MVKNEYKADRSRQNRKVSGHTVQRVIWIIAIVAVGILLAYKFLLSPQGMPTSLEVSKDGTQVERVNSLDSRQTDMPVEKEVSKTGTMGESREGTSRGSWGWGATGRSLRQNQPDPSYSDAQQLISKLAQMKPRHGKFSPEEIEEINRLLRELKRYGLSGSMAIREFLESGQDVSFANFTGKIPPEYLSLRLALIDALAQIGGTDATAYMASMLHTTTNPEEIALLARGLEQSAPGAYQAEIMKVVRTMLAQALKANPGQYSGLVHLLGVIQDYGDASLAIDLENIYRTSPSAWSEFALMALSKLPEGYGIQTLLKLVNEMSGSPGAHGTRYDIALRMLTQASREYTEASNALLKLATANKIGTPALIQIADALGGTEHQLITKSSGISQISNAEVFINGRAAETWSDAEINQRLALIDQFLRLNPQPAGAKALQDARNRLLVWKERPIVNGKRIKL
jgi:hypothetical protein